MILLVVHFCDSVIYLSLVSIIIMENELKLAPMFTGRSLYAWLLFECYARSVKKCSCLVFRWELFPVCDYGRLTFVCYCFTADALIMGELVY